MGNEASSPRDAGGDAPLPCMVFVLESMLWDPGCTGGQVPSSSRSLSLLDGGPTARMPWCQVLLENMELALLGGSQLPSQPVELRVKGASGNPTLRLRFIRESDVHSLHQHGPPPLALAEVDVPLWRLTRFGAPLYASVWLGLDSGADAEMAALGQAPLPLSFEDALARSRAPLAPKIRITVFKPRQADAVQIRHGTNGRSVPKPDTAGLSRDHGGGGDDMCMGPSVTKGPGPSDADQVEGLLMSVRASGDVVSSLQSNIFQIAEQGLQQSALKVELSSAYQEVGLLRAQLGGESGLGSQRNLKKVAQDQAERAQAQYQAQTQVAELEERLSDSGSEIVRLRFQLETERDDAATQLREMVALRERLEERERTARERTMNPPTSHADMHQMDQWREQATHAEHELMSTRAELVETRRQLETAEDRMAASRQKQLEMQDEVARKHNEYEAYAGSSGLLVEELRGEIARVGSELAESREAVRSGRARTNNTETEASLMQDQLSAQAKYVAVLEEDLARIRLDHEELQNGRFEDIARLQAQMDAQEMDAQDRLQAQMEGAMERNRREEVSVQSMENARWKQLCGQKDAEMALLHSQLKAQQAGDKAELVRLRSELDAQEAEHSQRRAELEAQLAIQKVEGQSVTAHLEAGLSRALESQKEENKRLRQELEAQSGKQRQLSELERARLLDEHAYELEAAMRAQLNGQQSADAQEVQRLQQFAEDQRLFAVEAQDKLRLYQEQQEGRGQEMSASSKEMAALRGKNAEAARAADAAKRELQVMTTELNSMRAQLEVALKKEKMLQGQQSGELRSQVAKAKKDLDLEKVRTVAQSAELQRLQGQLEEDKRSVEEMVWRLQERESELTQKQKELELRDQEVQNLRVTAREAFQQAQDLKGRVDRMEMKEKLDFDLGGPDVHDKEMSSLQDRLVQAQCDVQELTQQLEFERAEHSALGQGGQSGGTVSVGAPSLSKDSDRTLLLMFWRLLRERSIGNLHSELAEMVQNHLERRAIAVSRSDIDKLVKRADAARKGFTSKTAFQRLDLHGTGQVSINEFINALRRLGMFMDEDSAQFLFGVIAGCSQTEAGQQDTSMLAEQFFQQIFQDPRLNVGGEPGPPAQAMTARDLRPRGSGPLSSRSSGSTSARRTSPGVSPKGPPSERSGNSSPTSSQVATMRRLSSGGSTSNMTPPSQTPPRANSPGFGKVPRTAPNLGAPSSGPPGRAVSRGGSVTSSGLIGSAVDAARRSSGSKAGSRAPAPGAKATRSSGTAGLQGSSTASRSGVRRSSTGSRASSNRSSQANTPGATTPTGRETTPKAIDDRYHV